MKFSYKNQKWGFVTERKGMRFYRNVENPKDEVAEIIETGEVKDNINIKQMVRDSMTEEERKKEDKGNFKLKINNGFKIITKYERIVRFNYNQFLITAMEIGDIIKRFDSQDAITVVGSEYGLQKLNANFINYIESWISWRNAIKRFVLGVKDQEFIKDFEKCLNSLPIIDSYLECIRNSFHHAMGNPLYLGKLSTCSYCMNNNKSIIDIYIKNEYDRKLKIYSKEVTDYFVKKLNEDPDAVLNTINLHYKSVMNFYHNFVGDLIKLEKNNDL